jgi:hypothetical protein
MFAGLLLPSNSSELSPGNDGEHFILMIDAAAGTREKRLVIIIEFQFCFPRICGFVRDAVTIDHEVLLYDSCF